MAGEPLEHLLGWVSFAGARYVVTPGVFVPRRRSELLVDAVVQWKSVGCRDAERPTVTGLPTLRVVEMCCGAGAVGAAVAARIPTAEVWGCDLDPVAVTCARQNLPSDRVRQGDLYDALPDTLRGRVDVVVANAPYVPSAAIGTLPPEARDHEPRAALDGGVDGLDLHRRVFDEAGPWLVPGAAVVLETSRDQAAGTLAVATAAGFDARVVTDDALDATAVVARAQPPGVQRP